MEKKKPIKLLVLMNNLKIVTQIEEVLADIGDPNCKMIEPYVVGEQDTLSPWLVDCTNQNEFMISSDKILTILEPKPTLLEKYENLIK
jgi:hypothetical protein